MKNKDEFWEDYQYSAETDCLRDYSLTENRRVRGMKIHKFPE